MPGRYFSNTALPTTLAAGCTDVQTTISVTAVTGFPTSYPYTLTIDKNNAALAEAVEVTGAPTGTGPYTLPVTRGVDGTAGAAHSSDAVVSHDHTARDYSDLQIIEPRNQRFVRSFLFAG